MRLRDTAEPLAGAALGATLGEPVTAVTSGIGLIKALLPTPGLQKRIKQLTRCIEKHLPDGVEVSEAAVATAQEIARNHVRPVEDLAACGDDPACAAALALKRGRSLLLHFSDAETNEVRTLLVAYLGALRDDPSIVREVRARLQALTLEQVEAIADGMERQAAHADALQTLLARWIVRDVLYDPSVDSRRYRDDDDLGPAQLLNAVYEVVPFRGREHELDALRVFREQKFAPDDVGTRVIEGEGGLGKTRLAMEAVRHARRDGWQAGFLAPDADTETIRSGMAALDATGQPVFVVVDYGEDRPEQVATLLDAWLSAPSEHSRRMLLLVRQKGLLDQRLAPVVVQNPRLRPAVDYLQGARVQPLTASDLRVPPEERAALFREAQESFAARKGRPLDGLPAPPDTLTHDTPEYRHLGLPLYLHMAALASLDGPPTVQKLDLLRVVLDRNWSYVQRLLDAEPALDALHIQKPRLDEVLTVATLALAARPPSDEAPPDARVCLVLTPLGKRADHHVVIDELAAFLTETFRVDGTDGKRVFDALRPDALGEGLVFDTLSRVPNLLDAVLAMGRASQLSACTVLVRAALALAEDPAAWIEQLLPRERALSDPWLALALLLAIPEQTVHLAPLAVALAETVVSGLNSENEGMEVYRASLLSKLGDRLSAVGRHDNALVAAEESVAIWRRLAARAPDDFEPALAASLSSLGFRLSAVGHRDDALTAAKESVTIWRRLAAQAPDDFEPALAASLNTLFGCLREVGDHYAALVAAEESVAIRRRLTARAPDAFESDLAAILDNLGVALSAVNCHGDALVAAEESVAIWRRLAARAPDAFEPDLAMSLNNLGNRLSAVGRHDDALAAAEESVAIWRRLAERVPDAFEPDLARSLSNIGSHLSAVDRPGDALTAAEEAVGLYRRLAARAPDVFEPSLARSLGILGNRLVEMGGASKALEAYAEGLRLLTRFVQTVPEAFCNLTVLIIRSYLSACEATETEPDAALLVPLLSALGL